jgi:hypothetical protein
MSPQKKEMVSKLVENVQPLIRVKSPEFKILYANNATVVATQWDIHFYFGQTRESEPGKMITDESIGVIMTPEHAVALLNILKQSLEKYEDMQGKIREIKTQVFLQKPPEKGD